MDKVKIANLQTEQRNSRTQELDNMTASEIIQIMNEEDQHVITAVNRALPQISQAIEIITACLQGGGRLIYVGAGTSGRLGILDAVECVPTFSTDQVIAMMAGGTDAFVKAVEGAEDDCNLGELDLKNIHLCEKDVVMGIAASGRTPYVIGALQYVTQCGAHTIALSCNKNSEISKYAEVAIEVDAGPEILSGSTRLKAGTVQKMVLNMISTASMIGIGKVYKNLMVDMKATNAKLVERSYHIVMQATGCRYEAAKAVLIQSNQQIKIAIVMILKNCSVAEATQLLAQHHGFIRSCIE